MNLAREALLYLSLPAALLLGYTSQLLAEESLTVGVSLPLSGALAEDGGYYFKFPISVNRVTKKSAVAVFTSDLN